MAVRSVDCIGGEAPHTEVGRDMCRAADETGVDRHVEGDSWEC